ncbi:hypothetical protein AB1Y20_019979 [Prymnesium parvum]|uniref:Sulfatase-modifying factor enzyme-like domain-containing protein n=1 Tax=Prymnesium parvum TaxID=97485 RepID=A0AB34JW75_PRYPA
MRASEHRDRHFLGIHAGDAEPLEDRDVYGTFRQLVWRGELEYLFKQLSTAKAAFLDALPCADLPRRPGLNPVSWTVGHVAFTFDSLVADTLCLDKPGGFANGVSRVDAWKLYDSMRIGGDERWKMHERGMLPDVHEYLDAVHQQAETVLRECVNPDGRCPPVQSYLILYAIIHELWHTEDCVHTRNANQLPPPPSMLVLPASLATGEKRSPMTQLRPPTTDVTIPGGTFYLGAIQPKADRSTSPGGERAPPAKLVFDCEKWEHPVKLNQFRISQCCVTNAEFAVFVNAGGYEKFEYWSHEGARWLRSAGAQCPWLWRRDEDGSWLIRWFDKEVPLPPYQPVSHVHFWEAEAYCAWAHRRLPTEAEWEAACCGAPWPDGSLAPHKARSFPWGDEPPSDATANCGLRRASLLDVDDLPAGDSCWGVRQMIGNVWEWTATTFYPFPGYVMDFPYREQSAPWFGFTKVARGGCFATPDLILRGDYRSFYHPNERPELAVGFRTCGEYPILAAIRTGSALAQYVHVNLIWKMDHLILSFAAVD